MSSFASSNVTETFYKHVIGEVCRNMREAFMNEGVDEQVLTELKERWEQALTLTGALARTPEYDASSVHPLRGGVSTPSDNSRALLGAQSQKRQSRPEPVVTSVPVIRNTEPSNQPASHRSTELQLQQQQQQHKQKQQQQAQAQAQAQQQLQQQSSAAQLMQSAMLAAAQATPTAPMPQVMQYSGLGSFATTPFFYPMPPLIPLQGLAPGGLQLPVLATMPTTPVIQQQATAKVSSASDKARQKQPQKPSQVDGASASMDSDDNSGFNIEFEVELGAGHSEEDGFSPSDITTSTTQRSVQGDTCHLPPFLLLSPSMTTERKVSRKLRKKHRTSSVSLQMPPASLCLEEGEMGSGTSGGGICSGESDWRIPQLDGPHGDSSSENEEEEESDEDEEPEAGGSAGHSELDPNSDDDIEEGEDEEGVKDIVICQFDKVTRSNKTRWKFHLKNGIVNIRNRDYVFQKANGEAEW